MSGSDYRELLIGCGHRREKLMGPPDTQLRWRCLTTLDCYSECKPDILWNLNNVNWLWPISGSDLVIYDVIPDHTFDEVHAYEVLEHLGQQGDAEAFFACFSEIWRILKPGGWLFATVPSRYSAWLWGDPSHRRAILPETLTFLDQAQYTAQVGKTPMSDFRHLYKADFSNIHSTDNHIAHLFSMRAVKPSRISK